MMTDRASLRTTVAVAALTCAAGALIGTASGAAVLVAAATAAGVGTLLFLRIAAAHGWLTRQLKSRSVEGQVADTPIRLGSVGGSVFVAGLGRPTIFCDATLVDALADEELHAVTLHERAHQLARDPLRNAAVGVVAPLVRPFRRGHAWLERRAAHREIAADRYALAHGADRRAIAAALLKVPTATTAHAAPFAPAVELRLRALLDDETQVPAPRPLRAWLLGAGLGTVICLAMLHPAAQLVAVLRACCPS